MMTQAVVSHLVEVDGGYEAVVWQQKPSSTQNQR